MIFNLGGPVRRVPTLDAAHPADAAVNVGENAVFSVVISSDGNPSEYSYQWYVDGSAVSGATGPTYTRTSVTKGTHYVHCLVMSKAGSVKSRTATLTASRLFLFNGGDECDAVTGGWAAKACRPPDTSVSLAPTKTVSGTTMEAAITGVNSYGRAGVVQTKNAIDLSDYSTLVFHVTAAYNPEEKNCVGVMATHGGESFSYLASAAAQTGTVSIDISAINAAYAVCVAIVCNRYEIYGSSSVTVDAIYLE